MRLRAAFWAAVAHVAVVGCSSGPSRSAVEDAAPEASLPLGEMDAGTDLRDAARDASASPADTGMEANDLDGATTGTAAVDAAPDGRVEDSGADASDAAPTACEHTAECRPGHWCNPASRACESWLSAKRIGFRKGIYPLFAYYGCTGCHHPGGPGYVDSQSTGIPADYTGSPEEVYRVLTAGGIQCTPGFKGRVCVNDPKASLLMRRPLEEPAGTEPDHPAALFGTTNQREVRDILAWIARGAPLSLVATQGCGNGVRDADEECDEGAAPPQQCDYGQTSCEVCTAECTRTAGRTAYCGDGEVQALETCDDGNAVTELCPDDTRCATCGPDCTWVTGRTLR